MISDETQNTCYESVVTYFTKNSTAYEHFYEKHCNYAELWGGIVIHREKV